MNHSFQWIVFYRAIAQALQVYNNNRSDLFNLVRKLADQSSLIHYLHFEHHEFWQERDNQIDPFTVIGIFNRATTAEHRQELAQLLADALSVSITPPSNFRGIAHLDPRKSIYNGNEEMWNLFNQTISGKKTQLFEKAYTAAAQLKGNALGTLSIGLFWVNPECYMPLDSISIPYIQNKYNINPLPEKCSGQDYVNYLNSLDQKRGNLGYPELAFEAWSAKNN